MERFLDYFIPQHYALELCFHRERESLTGKVEISGTLQQNSVKLHAVELDIQSITWRPYAENDPEYDFIPCDFNEIPDGLEIPFDASMRKMLAEASDNVIVLQIKFSAQLGQNMQGCYLSTYDYHGVPQRLIATQFESHYARQCFPCVDEPAAKAKFDLTLILPDYDPAYDVVLANTEPIGQCNGRFDFATTPRMPTYLLAWVIGPLKSVSDMTDHGVRVSSYCALNQSTSSLLFANQTAVRALDYYHDQFGVSYPLVKLDQVALPDFEAGAMENWGLVTYRESMMLADEHATLDTKKTIATTVTHELSHQWFGNLVTMQWWDDLWLNESFATMMEYCATDALYPDFRIWDNFFVHECYTAFLRDCLPGVQSIRQDVHSPAEIATLFDPAIVYAKGAHLMLMLLRIIGCTKFFDGLKSYLERFQYDNTTGDDLWNCLQDFADFDVRDFMHAWISQPGYPSLQKTHNVDAEWWEQQRFLIDGTIDDTKWPLPKVKDDMSGHYLLDLGDKDFEVKLAKFDQLTSEQKLRLLLDRILLAKAGHVSSASLLDLLLKFTHEQSGATWVLLTSIINHLKIFCPPETPVADHYKSFLRGVTSGEIRALVLTEHPISSDALQRRDMLLSIAYYAENQTTLRELAELYQEDITMIDAELRGHILAAKMYFDEDKIFKHLLQQYQATYDAELKSDLLSTLAICSKDPDHLQKMLSLLQQPDIVRPQDHLFLYIYLLRNYRSRDQALGWLIQNWDYVVKLAGDKSIEDYPRYTASALVTPEEAQKFYAFFDPKQDLPILKRTLELAHTEIDSRLSMIQSQSDAVTAKLKKLTKGKL